MFRRTPSRGGRGRPAALEIVFGVGCSGISCFFFRLFFFERTRPAANMYHGTVYTRKITGIDSKTLACVSKVGAGDEAIGGWEVAVVFLGVCYAYRKMIT